MVGMSHQKESKNTGIRRLGHETKDPGSCPKKCEFTKDGDIMDDHGQ